MRLFMFFLVILVFLYPLIGAILMHIFSTSGISMEDAIYFSSITIFTIGYGDMRQVMDFVISNEIEFEFFI